MHNYNINILNVQKKKQSGQSLVDSRLLVTNVKLDSYAPVIEGKYNLINFNKTRLKFELKPPSLVDN